MRNQVVIRSSQPLCGILGNTSPDEEVYLGSLIDSCIEEDEGYENITKDSLHIFDCRSYIAATTNVLNGGGYEEIGKLITYLTDRYGHSSKISFLSLANIHSLASSHLSYLVKLANHRIH